MTDTTTYLFYASALHARKDDCYKRIQVANVYWCRTLSLPLARIHAIDRAKELWPKSDGYYDYDEITVEIPDAADLTATAPASADTDGEEDTS